jgi:hypothetical protein
MRMTPDQILLVQTSFAMTGADGTALARSLSARLGAPGTQVAPLAGLLVLAVRGLSRRGLLRPALQRLAARHHGLRHAALDAAALVDALEEALGARLPRAAVDAWRAWHRLTSDLLRPAHA